MISCKDELLDKLCKNHLYYKDEISLLTDGLPQFIRNTVEVSKLAENSYYFTYLFFGRPICYALSFTKHPEPILDFLQKNPSFTEVHTNLSLGEKELCGMRNIYGNSGAKIVPAQCKIDNLQVIRITPEEIGSLDQLKEEITRSQFESYDFLRDSVLSGQLALYGAVAEGKCLAYVRLNPHNARHIGKSIVEPTVYTAEKYRKQGIASALLTTVFTKHYADCEITYGVDTQNTASNHLAQSIGLSYLGTKYRYTNN